MYKDIDHCIKKEQSTLACIVFQLNIQQFIKCMVAKVVVYSSLMLGSVLLLSFLFRCVVDLGRLREYLKLHRNGHDVEFQ